MKIKQNTANNTNLWRYTVIFLKKYSPFQINRFITVCTAWKYLLVEAQRLEINYQQFSTSEWLYIYARVMITWLLGQWAVQQCLIGNNLNTEENMLVVDRVVCDGNTATRKYLYIKREKYKSHIKKCVHWLFLVNSSPHFLSPKCGLAM